MCYIMKHLFLFLWFAWLSPLVRAQQNSGSTELTIGKVAAVGLKLDGYPDFLAADSNHVWVTNVNRVDKLSSSSSKPILSAAVPRPCGAMTVGFGALWVASCANQSIYRIDRKTGKSVAIIPTGLADRYGELSLAVGAGSVWVLSDSSGILSRIDPLTNTIQATIKVLPNSYCVAFGYDAIWITSTGLVRPIPGTGRVEAKMPGSVQRINPQTNEVIATVPIGLSPRFLAVGENGVWVLNQADGTISRIDPLTNQLTATIAGKVVGLGGDIATGAGRVWVRGNKTAFLISINPATNLVERRYGPVSGSGAVRVTADKRVWITAHDINTIWILNQ